MVTVSMIFLVLMSSNSEAIIPSEELSPSKRIRVLTVLKAMCFRVCIDGRSMPERLSCLIFRGSETRMERGIRNLYDLGEDITYKICLH